MKTVYPEERGSIDIHGHKFEWSLRRSKGASVFGIRGSRIFALTIKKDGHMVLDYERGYSGLKKPDQEDEELALCLSYLIDKYGKERRREKK